MDVSIRRGKSFESGYCNLLDKTGLAPNVKGDHRGMYSRVTHPRRGVTFESWVLFRLPSWSRRGYTRPSRGLLHLPNSQWCSGYLEQTTSPREQNHKAAARWLDRL